jgi:hypothetical protein
VADVDSVTQRTQSTEHEGHEQAECDVTAVTMELAMGLLEEVLQPWEGGGRMGEIAASAKGHGQ